MPPQVQNAYNALNSFKTKSPTDYLNEANQQFGVGQAQNQVNSLNTTVSNLQNAINAVAPSVAGRTTGTFTTQAQRDALVAKEQQPLQTSLGTQAQALGNAQNAYSMAAQQAGNLASANASADTQRYNQLAQQYANAYGAWQDALNLAEKQRQFNLSNANTGQSIANELGLGNTTNNFTNTAAKTTSAPGAGGVGSQSADYNWVKNLITGVQNADPSAISLWQSTMKGAQGGNQREKQLLQAFYSLQGKAIPANFVKALS